MSGPGVLGKCDSIISAVRECSKRGFHIRAARGMELGAEGPLHCIGVDASSGSNSIFQCAAAIFFWWPTNQQWWSNGRTMGHATLG